MVMMMSNMVMLPLMTENLLSKSINFRGKNMNLNHANIVMAPTNHKFCAIKTSATIDDGKFVDITSKQKNIDTAATVILAGGAGDRLFPLTQRRAKPAVPIGGAYRLIDVALSNCFNSGLHKIYIMTQFNSASLNRHISGTYNLSNNAALSGCFVEVLAATQTPDEDGTKWFQGTADAVRQFDWLFKGEKAKEIEDILILSGDHLYKMDYMNLIESHRLSGADVTISCLPMDDSRASDFGLMKFDNTGRVVSFCEKPKGDDLKAMEVDTTVLGLSVKEAKKKPYIASMGIYVFKKNVLLNLLRTHFPKANDFGSEIIPPSAKEFLVKAFLFNDYWEDISTIRSFYEANLALTDDEPRFNFYDEDNPMYTCKRNLPPSMVNSCKVVDSIISQGCILDHCSLEHSIIGIRSQIRTNVSLKDTVMFGADFYETDKEREKMLDEGKVPIGIGENTKIRKCIIDKNARIGRNVLIANSEDVQEASQISEGLFIKEGIVIISKNSIVTDGFVL